MAPSMTEDGLKKLSVPQLKLMCKEKCIVGYSKLAKDAVIAKLLNWQRLQSPLPRGDVTTINTSSEVFFGSGNTRNLVSTKQSQQASTAISKPTSHLLPIDVSKVQDPLLNLPGAARNYDSGPTETKSNVPTSQGAQGLSTTGSFAVLLDSGIKSQDVSVNLRRAIPVAITSKRRLDEWESSPTNVQKKSRSNEIIDGSTVVSTGPKGMSSASSKATSSTSTTQKNASGYRTSENTNLSAIIPSKRFKALMPHTTTPNAISGHPTSTVSFKYTAPSKLKNAHSEVSNISRYLDFELASSTITLKPISFPPSVAQRKNVPRLALILSRISLEDLPACALVSRSFRYSAYLSAVNQLSRKFLGKRLQNTLLDYSSKMTNFWPYLRHRHEEAKERQSIYEASFLGRAVKGVYGIAEGLWSSPDHEKQATIAVRFLLTRLFFYVSLGHGGDELKSGKEKDYWLVLDAQEVIPHEIWKISFRSSSSIHFFYVLEATCEVVGEPEVNSPALSSIGNLRADWSDYIASRLNCPTQSDPIVCPPGLLEHLQWTNHEEYAKGISKLWLSKLEREGGIGVAKLTVAQRYVLACVASNSVSGPWLTSNEMLQDFSGLPSKMHLKRERGSTSQRINMFMPPHHHVESIHFTSSDGKDLHPAVAVVQTPGREYYILKDNGMQVGCEEDGIAPVWMELIGCTETGCLRM
ncbi:hypothetical protein BDZ97DRAFT_914993 [Flammula alnicola]|nr:hypothetical protein BDZ97DRAFT_914993 [Flammula alnicola]